MRDGNGLNNISIRQDCIQEYTVPVLCMYCGEQYGTRGGFRINKPTHGICEGCVSTREDCEHIRSYREKISAAPLPGLRGADPKQDLLQPAPPASANDSYSSEI